MPKSKEKEDVIITVVGDGAVGKTAMMMVHIHNNFPEDYLPTTFEYHTHEIIIDNVKYNLLFRDTAGQDDYDMMLPLNFPNTNCFLLCYSVEKSDHSYANVDLKWVPLLRHYNPETPIILVGTKIDLREHSNTECYTYQDGLILMEKIKAQGYVECSSKINHDVNYVIVKGVKAHLNYTRNNRDKLNQNESRRVKIVFVGDGCAGKDCLIRTYVNKEFPTTYIPIVFECYVKETIVGGIQYTLTIWEVAGQEDYDRLRPLCYPNTNCFVLCFGVDSKFAYVNAKDHWIQELRHHNPRTPIVVAGMKIDLRSDTAKPCLTYEDGVKLVKNIGADAYVECSAKAGVGVEEVFMAAIKAHDASILKEKEKKEKESGKKSCVLN